VSPLDDVRRLIEEGLRQDVFSGAVVRIRRAGEDLFHDAFGQAELTPHPRPMTRDLSFDVASLTKVMATLPAVLRSVQLGKLSLYRLVEEILPEWRRPVGGPTRCSLTLEHLLTHTSGLPGWRPLYLAARTPQEVLELICREPLEHPVGTRVVYSDLGLMLAGLILERVWGKPLQEICNELVFRPLGMTETRFQPSGTSVPREQVVACEHGTLYEKGMCRDFADTCEREPNRAGLWITKESPENFAWRTETIAGQVHDCNAYHAMGGVSGHAGLFSTVADATRYLEMWQNGGLHDGRVFLEPQWVKTACSNRTPTLNIARGLGFEAGPAPGTAQGDSGCSAGPLAGPGSFGHTGFTGVSLWHDPRSGVGVVLFTTRTHPVMDPEKLTKMIRWRYQLHTAAFSL
jgi:serine-type D-Ala-D-Ala carboxypeptidase